MYTCISFCSSVWPWISTGLLLPFGCALPLADFEGSSFSTSMHTVVVPLSLQLLWLMRRGVLLWFRSEFPVLIESNSFPVIFICLYIFLEYSLFRFCSCLNWAVCFLLNCMCSSCILGGYLSLLRLESWVCHSFSGLSFYVFQSVLGCTKLFNFKGI